ncbi:uncharacterized protein I303_100214 [Kwoniella dejecticola CBS 10117]|uniref:Uncharacterized protein n=1 Tax=Kwoniella dejecticola CBS 10117 TaxID=1296121 RepID=A0A1A6AEC9_9TREE|nr:uncharacterized protein I303_00216 [Kwoniella dejecticola CBS 10117]OBR88399.1 hypothetical protein I303_00216 [Kwoniella dejecticola CBS 10117]
MTIPISRTARSQPVQRSSGPKISSQQIDPPVNLERKMSSPPKIVFIDPFDPSSSTTGIVVPAPVQYVSPSTCDAQPLHARMTHEYSQGSPDEARGSAESPLEASSNKTSETSGSIPVPPYEAVLTHLVAHDQQGIGLKV